MSNSSRTRSAAARGPSVNRPRERDNLRSPNGPAPWCMVAGLMQRTAFLLVLPALALLAGACSRESPAAPSPPGPGKAAERPADATPVIVGQVEQRDFVPDIEGLGTARALESVLVTSRVSGRVQEIFFREGARAKAEQPLVRLEDDEERAELKATEAEAEQAESRRQRMTELNSKGLVSRDQLEEQNQVAKSAQARLELARVRLAQRTIRAPFAGVLGFRQQSLGSLVQPGSPVVTLDDVDRLRVEFSVAEALLGDLVPGATVEVRAAAWPERTFTGRITALDTRVDEVTRAVRVQAQLDNRDGALKPGMLLTVRAQGRRRQSLFVPESALTPENARQFVWRVGAEDKVEKIEVALGARLTGSVEVRGELAAGDRIVVEGQPQLRPGRIVRVVTPPAPAPG
jgi:membrane fusion protein (multidrug efflux system)